jgi:hypothetical protein
VKVRARLRRVLAGEPLRHRSVILAGDERREFRAAVRQIEVPARLGRRLRPASFVLAGVTVFLLWVAVTGLLRQGSLGLVLSAGWAELAAPLLVGLVVVTGIGERFWPAEPRPVLARGHVQDACFLALHAIVVIPLMTLLSVGAATLIGGHAQWIELWPAQNWSGWLLVPLTIVAMDAANWLAHYADHRFTALWRFHALHHSQEELSVLTSFRAHPLMHTTGFLLASIPVVVLMPARPPGPRRAGRPGGAAFAAYGRPAHRALSGPALTSTERADYRQQVGVQTWPRARSRVALRSQG